MIPLPGSAPAAGVTDRAIGDFEVVDQPGVRQIEALVAYWESKRAGRIACRRSDIDPTELASHLPNIFMLDVLGGGDDFRYRLIGTQIVQGLGRDSTGRRVSELYADHPAALEKLSGLFRKVVAGKRPLFGRGNVFWLPSRDIRRFVVGFLPLSDDGIAVDIILAELFIFWSDASPAS